MSQAIKMNIHIIKMIIMHIIDKHTVREIPRFIINNFLVVQPPMMFDLKIVTRNSYHGFHCNKSHAFRPDNTDKARS